MRPVVVFAGGGTGGHLMPALATVESLRELAEDADIIFFITGREIELKCLSGSDIHAVRIPAGGWNESVKGKLDYLGKLPAATRRVHSIYRRIRPDVVVGLGGYASVVPVLAAKAMGVPIMLFESNTVPGKVTRLLSHWADEVQVQFGSTLDRLYRRKAIVTGNPIRKRIFMGEPRRAFDRFKLDPGKRTLLVMGGSQGSAPINACVGQALQLLKPLAGKLQILHLAGAYGEKEARAFYEGSSIDSCVVAYLEEIEDAYAIADMALCRAGGSSIAELTAMGIPSILVPYPFAADRHQHFNALELVRRGAAWLIRQQHLTPDVLSHSVYSILFDDRVLALMKRAALRAGRRGAAHLVAEEILKLSARDEHKSRSDEGIDFSEMLAA